MRTAGHERFDGFVHVAGGVLRDGRGRPLVLRGIGLGNWLLREGYMWTFEPGGPLSSHAIEDLVTDLVGAQASARFWCDYHDRFVTEADIARIAAEGFDHVRLPINARVVQDQVTGELLEDGFRLVDRCIEWCRTHGLWVVLDLHGAPGGQTGTNIDDSPNGLPELYGNEHYTALTVDLWSALATRYRDETVVAAYDLLNEPLPNEYQHLLADELVALYKQLTAAIRAIDTVHPIIYEGLHWATNWDIFTEVWDANAILQCHKYWSPPDLAAVRQFVVRGRELGLPVYMGETGENNAEWLQAAFQLYDDCGMSWNFWPWKKIETLTSPCSVDAPAGYDAVVAYARGLGPKPDAVHAQRVLDDLLEAFDVEACTYRRDIVNALLHRAPLRLTAWAFGFRGAGSSYDVKSGVPLAGFRADDSVTLQTTTFTADGEPVFEHKDGRARTADEAIVVRLDRGDWVSYDVAVPGERVSVAVESTGPVAVTVDGARASPGEFVSVTGDGPHAVRVTAEADGVTLRWLDVRLP